MTTRILLILGISIATLHAADPTPADLLRQGLFEEEANQNLDQAAEHYRAVIAAHERQRALAASATFRLGEIARKKNDKEAAAAAFRTVTERFPEQQELARLSRENLAALGIEAPPAAAPASVDPEDAEIARLKEIARNSPDLIDGAGADGWRPIHHAAARGQTRVLAYLLENNAIPDGMTVTEQLTPLHLAAIHGHLGTVKILLAAKADPNLTFNIEKANADKFPPTSLRYNKPAGRWTALDLAILYDRRETALALIKAGADIQRVGPVIDWYKEGFNALILAIYLQREDLAQALIDAGSSLGAIGNDDPITPLYVAVMKYPAMVAPLLKAGADPKQPARAERYTPLHQASSRDIETARLLIAAGADVKATTSDGTTPLHWAANAEMAEFLISKGADPNAKDSSGLTTLDHVVARDNAGSKTALIETLLKHGASVEDPLVLLRRTSEAMLPWVREHLVYPKMHRPDAILLSVSGNHSFNPPPPPTSSRGRVRPRMVSGSSQSRPDLITLESRPSSDTPPPSLAEALSEAYGATDYLQFIRILRRNANQAFGTVREWTFAENSALPRNWPALQWGDILEVRITNGYNSSQEPPRIDDLRSLIPARTVTFRLGDLAIPKTIPGSDTFWLGDNSGETLQTLIPGIDVLADLRRFTIHRKGLPDPIKLDFSAPTGTRFRLLDGDTVGVSWDIPRIYEIFRDERVNHMLSLAGKGDSGSTGATGTLVDVMASVRSSSLQSGFPITPPVDFSRICILRRAQNWKPEMVDLIAWLDQLPPREQWEKDGLVKSAPKLDPGDLVILIEDQVADAEKRAAETIKRTKEVGGAMRPNIRPKVVPPPPVGR